MAKDNLIKIGGELKSVAADGVVAGAEAIYDYSESKSQATINQDLKQAIEDIDVTDQISGKADKSEMSVVAGTGADADKTTITLKNGTSATVLTQHQDVSDKEDKSNKVTSFSSPTDTQYPSAKLVSDQLATKQDTISDLSTIRSGAAAGATAVQPATTLAGYGITDGYTKTEGQALESSVDNRLDGQDAAIALLNGSEVIVVADHTQVASPNSQKIYREQGSTSYTDWMYQDSTWKEIATYVFPGVDDEPTAESDNLVKSGGVFKNLTELGGEVAQLGQEVGDIKKDGSVYEINAIIPVTQGTAIASRVNIASGISIPAGTTIKVKLSGTTGVISEVHIVDNSWRNLFKGIYNDGAELILQLSYETTSLGLNLTTDTAIGTGDVKIMVSYSYESSLGYKVDEFTEEMNIINTARMCDVGKMSFSQGAFYTVAGNNRGKEAPLSTAIRCDGALVTPFMIDVPEGFIIGQVLYYSSWISNSNCTCVLYENVNLRHYVVSSNYPLFRYTIKKANGAAITPSDFYSALNMVMPIVNTQNSALSTSLSMLAQNGFLFTDEVTIPVTQGTAILSRNNLFAGISLSEGDTIKIQLQGTSVLGEVWIINDQWRTIYKGTYTEGDIITATLNEPTTSAGLYVDADKAIGTGNVIVLFNLSYDDSLGGRISTLENASVKTNIITVKRYGTSGVDADFCGLNAIGDAVASITDANEKNQYAIMIDGHFLFTNPKMVEDGGDFKYTEGGEPTPVISKEYVHFIGTDKGQAVVEVRLDANLQDSDFPEGKTFTDYQPIYIRTSCHIRNMTFIGTNTRYTAHIETNNVDKGVEIHFEDCVIISKLSTKGYKSVMTIGEIPYFNLMMERCDFINENSITNTLFSGHTPLSNITNGRENCLILFKDCNFKTHGVISLGTYAYNRKDVMTFTGCKFHPKTIVRAGANSGSKRELGTLVEQRFNNPAMPFNLYPQEPCGLRVRTITGNPSSVRFDYTCSAFAIVGNANEGTQVTMPYSAVKEYGYEYKDDFNGSHAYACGWVNIDPLTGSSLGSILGDCSVTSKTLKIVINEIDYNVVFNSNLTNETNENIIAAINAVIGSVALCDTFNPELQQYPDFDGEEYFLTNGDSAAIERGMGVVKTDSNVIRRAKQSDGYIDGIAVDTIYPGQSGRIITKGELWSIVDGGGRYYLSTNPVLSIDTYGANISIDANNDGKFIVSNDAPVLRSLKDTIVEIL